MVAIELQVDDELCGAILDEHKRQLLPVVFPGPISASCFLAACERTGVEIYAGMPHGELRRLYDLWHDAAKRPDSSSTSISYIGGAGFDTRPKEAT